MNFSKVVRAQSPGALVETHLDSLPIDCIQIQLVCLFLFENYFLLDYYQDSLVNYSVAVVKSYHNVIVSFEMDSELLSVLIYSTLSGPSARLQLWSNFSPVKWLHPSGPLNRHSAVSIGAHSGCFL